MVLLEMEEVDKNREKKFSLYVKGVVNGMNRTTLTNAFTLFGPVRNVDVVIAKSCAFVEFGTEEAYQQALMREEIDIPNLGTVIVEERKSKSRPNRNHRATNNYLSESPKVPTPITRNDDNDKVYSLYMKGVVDGMNRDVLTNAFTKFGAVENLDVVLAKKCAFVKFKTEEAYQQALMQKEIDIPNLGTVVVEERKSKSGSRYTQNNNTRNNNTRNNNFRQRRSNYY